METKGKVRSFADIFGEESEPVLVHKNGITDIELSNLVTFENHPFKLYEGERLDDMVVSIKELGVILPIVVRKKGEVFEILSGHNRVNAAKLAGLSRVPAVIKEGLTEDEAKLIVTETNLLQRSFSDLNYSEKAIALKIHYNAIKQQGKRNDLINEIEVLSNPHKINSLSSCSQVGNKSKSISKVGEQYDLSKNTVARYLRLNELIPELLERVDNEDIAFIPAVALSFINKAEQKEIERIIAENNFKVDMIKADILRSNSELGNLSVDKIYAILSGELTKKKKSNKPEAVKVKPKIIARFFTQEHKAAEIEEVIEKALELYFSNLGQAQV